MNTYKTTVGIEVHAELKTKTKMFCSCANDPHHGKPNTNICPVCMAHPGTLPVMNKEAVLSVLRVGTALGSSLASFTEFDRKNYFYPDIPKGYQISQYEHPLVKGGTLSGVAITRVHLEEDTARSLHESGEGSLIDYNRAGVPLMELVTEPVIHDAKTAGNFARELQLLLRTLDVSDANMERGEMRVEANISVSASEKLGTKVEVKNLNSFKSVEAAVDYEVRRQIHILESGEKVVQETRGWDENKLKTFSQRVKESANDYRYFPEPDLPKIDFTSRDTHFLSRIEENMPELPEILRTKYSNLGLTREQIEIIISDKNLKNFFETTLIASSGEASLNAPIIANYLTTDILSHIDSTSKLQNAYPSEFALMVGLILSNTLTSRVAKDLLSEVVFEGKNAELLARERNLIQNNSEDDLLAIIDTIIRENEKVVLEYKSGKESALQYLVGCGMKITKGSANPMLLAKLLKKQIS